MSRDDATSRLRRKRTAARRRRALLTGLSLFAALSVLVGAVVVSEEENPRERTPPPAPEGKVQLVRGDRVVRELGVDSLRTRPARDRLAAAFPRQRVARVGRSRVTWDLDRPALTRSLRRAVLADGGRVAVPETALASRTVLPIIKQRLRNTCETAALSMLLAAKGKRVEQARLQRLLPRSGPPDPTVENGAEVWGDPERGFVGRPEGGGGAGGYGVYPPPIQALARRQGVVLRDLTGASYARLYRRLAEGHPMIAWIGLSAGPYKTWRTPSGRTIKGNFGEHTVVLTGINGNELAVNDPIDGRRKVWTKDYFEQRFPRLGRRALSL